MLDNRNKNQDGYLSDEYLYAEDKYKIMERKDKTCSDIPFIRVELGLARFRKIIPR
jgi:hypothetical protein